MFVRTDGKLHAFKCFVLRKCQLIHVNALSELQINNDSVYHQTKERINENSDTSFQTVNNSIQ